MKKLNNKGFVLAETLVVTVFMMVLFSTIYSHLYPLIGLYEQREIYDDIDGKYSAYWIKRLIEDPLYDLSETDKNTIESNGYVRFKCDNMDNTDNRQLNCIDLVNELEINNCDQLGNNCDIFITKYRIGSNNPSEINFKNVVKKSVAGKVYRAEEGCGSGRECLNIYYDNCCTNAGITGYSCTDVDNTDYGSLTPENKKIVRQCKKEAKSYIFTASFRDYVNTLPDYVKPSDVKYRVFLVTHHKKDSNNYYSFSNMEVNK